MGRPKDGAFTLIEVMIAMALTVMILTAVYSSWTAILRSTRIGINEASRIQRERMTMRTVIDSLLSIQMFASSPGYYAFETDTKSEYSAISFVAHLPQSFPRGGYYGDQVVRRVTFKVEPGTNTPAQLVMEQTPMLADENQQWPPLVLAKDVTAFTLEFWDTRANDWAEEWKFTNALPKLVRVTLGTGLPNVMVTKPEDMITRVVALPAMMVPREIPGGGPQQGTNTGGINQIGNRPGQGPRGGNLR
jgi:prepilin-type N-terminal cleavage/methylation domain-containing protein